MPQFISKDELNNTVSSRNQLPESLYVTFENLSSNNSKRILFIGNSITRHAPKPDIGWTLDCGMAASCKQKDYVHVVISSVLENDPDAGFCITQGAVWERDFDCDLAKNFSSAQDFAADIIVYRLGENIPNEGLTKERYLGNG